MIDRRQLLTGAAALALLAAVTPPAIARPARSLATRAATARLRAIEAEAQGRLGAYVLDTGTGAGFGWRADERFAHCSSFKLSLAALVLSLADQGELALDEVVPYTRDDLLSHSPVTSEHVDEGGLPARELARAALVTSDNAAANVLLRRVGGPDRLTGFWRSLGDPVSRLDRTEPALNAVPPGTELDTTTPSAMASTVAKLVTGHALTPTSRDTLRAWATDVQTGGNRLRAGLPADWPAGDKTGTGLGDTTHTYVDLAFATPPGRAPIVIAAWFEPAKLVDRIDPAAEAALADVARVAAAWAGR